MQNDVQTTASEGLLGGDFNGGSKWFWLYSIVVICFVSSDGYHSSAII